MNPQEYKTVAGIPADQIRSCLAKPFSDSNAYKQVAGTGADLTDINTGHMLKRVNEVFGMKGLGWNLLYDRDDIVINPIENNKHVIARLKFAEFIYFLVHNESGEQIEIRIPTSGANKNTPQYAEEGVKTVALGTALKGMGFQEYVYTGHLDHRNAQSFHSAYLRKAASKNGKNGKATSAKADPGNFIITFGKNKGEKLSEVLPKAVDWYANTMEAKGDKSAALQQAAIAYLATKAGKNDSGNGNDGNGNGNGNGNGDFVVSFGKNKGQTLSELSPESLLWYAEEMSPINDAGKTLKQAAVALLQTA